MASFDFIDAAAKGYDIIFRNFFYLARVAMPVLFMTVLCFLIMMTISIDVSMTRFGLIMFPAFLLQGLYCSGLVRFVLFGEQIYVWGTLVPMPEKSNQLNPGAYIHGNLTRTQSLQAGAVTYTLISMLSIFFTELLDYIGRISASVPPEATPPQVNDISAVAGIFIVVPILGAFLWIIRLFYIYIPISMGFTYRYYIHAMRGMMSSVSIFALLLLCTLPIATLSSPLFQIAWFLCRPIPGVFPVVFVVVLTIITLLSLSVLVAAAAIGINQVMQKDMSNR